MSTKFAANLTPLFGDQPLGTDPWMACNAYSYQTRTGVLKDTRERFFIGRRYGEYEQLSDLLGTTVIGSIYNRKDELISKLVNRDDLESMLVSANFFNWRKPSPPAEMGVVRDLLPVDKDQRLQRCMHEEDKARLAYKGRPLTGIWATAQAALLPETPISAMTTVTPLLPWTNGKLWWST